MRPMSPLMSLVQQLGILVAARLRVDSDFTTFQDSELIIGCFFED